MKQKSDAQVMREIIEGRNNKPESEETEVKKFKSMITEFSQESEVVDSWEGSFTGGYLSRIGIADVEIPSRNPLDRGEFLGKEVTIIIGDSESEVPKQEELESKIKVLIEAYKQEDGAYSNPENGWISGFVEDLKNLVEEEQKYYVEINGHYLSRGATKLFLHERKPTILKHVFTEQEIKDYDPRYWSFRKPVEEVEK